MARSGTRLRPGSRVGVIGGGPAGAFTSYFLLQMAGRAGLDLGVDVLEPRNFMQKAPHGCNMCGGIISESLVQNLAAEGIELPATIIQRRLDSYTLHMDVGTVRIETPLHEARIAAVARGGGPRTSLFPHPSFDAFLLEMAVQAGANHIPERVQELTMDDGRPVVRTAAGSTPYDLVVAAIGVNAPLLDRFRGLGSYRPPRRTKAYVAEFELGETMIERYLGNSMHVFLLNFPGLDFAALIPKSSFVTLCLLGEGIDRKMVDAFLASPVVQECMPPHWRAPSDHCHCSPKLNVRTAVQPFGDRIVFIGDCGTTRLFKDGIGAAYRTSKAAARTIVFDGVGEAEFRRGFQPACRGIDRDNRIGRVVFGITRQIQRRKYARRGLWRMTSLEQKRERSQRRMSQVLWDTFTGSAPYSSVFLRALHPAAMGRLLWETGAGLGDGERIRPKETFIMASGETGLMGRRYAADDVIFQQGDRGEAMFVIQSGKVELVRRDGDREFHLGTFGRGDFFGEPALFDDEIRRFTARAVEESFVFTLERSGLLRRVHEDPSMTFRLMERMSRRIRDLEDSLIRQARVLSD
ncbi:MAG: cyclic nucleotide-binding domain-containing protein [Acidobacteriota bacterium]|jgi:flavin-dependent dehydrogenase